MDVSSVIEMGSGIISALIFMTSPPYVLPASCATVSLLHVEEWI